MEKGISLNQGMREAYVVMCASIDHFESFKNRAQYQEFSPKARRIVSGLVTNLVKMREHIPTELSTKECKTLINSLKGYKLQLTYTGDKRMTVKQDDIEDLVSYAISGICKDCTRAGKEEKRCKFKKEWHVILAEVNENERSGECIYSFRGYHNA